MEVGIEDCLHIEFEYNRSKYHLKDAVLGKIFFLLVRVFGTNGVSARLTPTFVVGGGPQVRIKIKHMEIAIIKRESTGSGANTYNENETVAKFEIMDGAPVRGTPAAEYACLCMMSPWCNCEDLFVGRAAQASPSRFACF